eukprot:TRINITY_DN321_c0_g1_i3.p1 TRINITY_DN321_c0_g1~~TRINITY_DN321_c0_g1_i3.p1  ORF type:complete len:104 (+),score=42.01 TRINITY_DN321_c0_g1_i3:405-716(+)
MDEEGWYSVTAEVIAKHIAQRSCDKTKIVVDAFCGVGGNTIQFARQSAFVIAIDNNAQRLNFAIHNSKIYETNNNIDFILADSPTILKCFRVTNLFILIIIKN